MSFIQGKTIHGWGLQCLTSNGTFPEKLWAGASFIECLLEAARQKQSMIGRDCISDLIYKDQGTRK